MSKPPVRARLVVDDAARHAAQTARATAAAGAPKVPHPMFSKAMKDAALRLMAGGG